MFQTLSPWSFPDLGSPETLFDFQTVESILGLATFNCKLKQESPQLRAALRPHPPLRSVSAFPLP